MKTTVTFPAIKTPKQSKKQYCFTISGDHLSESKVSRITAESISHFARRPVIWGDEVINPHYSVLI